MEWISVEDEAPPTMYEDYLLVGNNEFSGDRVVVFGSLLEFPFATHWMPLPSPPEAT
jgi:hypothetical protein